MEKEIGKRLRHVRTLLKLSGSAIAAELGIKQPTYWNHENGSLEIRVNTLKTMYLKFGVLPHYICTGEGPVFRNKEEGKGLITDINQIRATQLAMTAKLDYITRNKL